VHRIVLSSAAFLQHCHSSHALMSDAVRRAELRSHALTSGVDRRAARGTIHRCGTIACAIAAGLTVGGGINDSAFFRTTFERSWLCHKHRSAKLQPCTDQLPPGPAANLVHCAVLSGTLAQA
jgi:hypothetical protein